MLKAEPGCATSQYRCTKLFVSCRLKALKRSCDRQNFSCKLSYDQSPPCRRPGKRVRDVLCVGRSAIAKTLVRDASRVTKPALAPGNGPTTTILKSIVLIRKAGPYSPVSTTTLLNPLPLEWYLKVVQEMCLSHRMRRPRSGFPRRNLHHMDSTQTPKTCLVELMRTTREKKLQASLDFLEQETTQVL
jgi:hypothetical protein